MDYMDSNKIGQRIENKLIHALGRTISEATNDEIYKAAAECIRDDIMISWADSRKRVQEQGVKKLYYMSAEFLMGRAFSNNLISQGLYEAYREAFWEMGLDFDSWSYLLRQAPWQSGSIRPQNTGRWPAAAAGGPPPRCRRAPGPPLWRRCRRPPASPAPPARWCCPCSGPR